MNWRGAIDWLLDRTVVFGYSRLGYEVREQIFDWGPVSLRGRTVMVTGASSGIGEAAAGQMAAAGATVHMVARNPGRVRAARERILERPDVRGAGDRIHLHVCDLSDLDRVHEFAIGFAAAGTSLDVLVHNAGVLPSERTRTAAGFELAFATNLLGPFLLTELLLEVLGRGANPAVIFVSSGGMYLHRWESDERVDRGLDREHDYSGTRAYARTKRGLVMLAEEWSAREPKVEFTAMHPGWVGTPGVSGSLPGFDRFAGPILRTPGQGADTICWLAAPDPTRTEAFWHDRRPRPRYRFGAFREQAAERARLFEDLAAYTAPWCDAAD